MYSVTKSIDIDFAHHVRGHLGRCINLHGHTWRFEATIESPALSKQGFVLDFGDLKKKLLVPVHDLLDHSLAVGRDTYNEIKDDLISLGVKLVGSRTTIHGDWASPPEVNPSLILNGAHFELAGGTRVAVFPFTPTSERLAEWFYGLADITLCAGTDLSVSEVRVYETLHPVQSYASFRR